MNESEKKFKELEGKQVELWDKYIKLEEEHEKALTTEQDLKSRLNKCVMEVVDLQMEIAKYDPKQVMKKVMESND